MSYGMVLAEVSSEDPADGITQNVWHNRRQAALSFPLERSLAVLRTRFRRPAPGLEQFVRFYVQREIQIRGAAVVHPVPARAAPLIEFDFGDPINVLDYKQLAWRRSPAIVLVGPQTYRRVEMQLQGALESFVIMFQPDGLHRLFSVPMHELTDKDYEGYSVLGAFVSVVQSHLGGCKSLEERARCVDGFLLRRAMDSRGYDGISDAANRLVRGGGRLEIAALADRAGLSMRQFERRFIHQMGMRPKLLARIARFEAALETKARFATKSWTDVAHEFGYYDQMHMVHDFREFTDKTPTETLIQLEAVFVEQIKTMRSGPRSAKAPGSSRLIL
jgi:AraC-like DNA-binding protein